MNNLNQRINSVINPYNKSVFLIPYFDKRVASNDAFKIHEVLRTTMYNQIEMTICYPFHDRL